MWLQVPFLFLFFANQFLKASEIQVGFLEEIMLFVIKGYLLMRIVESI
jgi:hypothetical protein